MIFPPKGIGYGMFIVSALVSIYYNMIIAWAFFYLFASFTDELPWQSCGDWSTNRKFLFIGGTYVIK